MQQWSLLSVAHSPNGTLYVGGGVRVVKGVDDTRCSCWRRSPVHAVAVGGDECTTERTERLNAAYRYGFGHKARHHHPVSCFWHVVTRKDIHISHIRICIIYKSHIDIL